MKSTVIYMAVQVVRRDDSGTLMEWYDGDMHASLVAAQEEAKENALAHPGTPYQVVERTIKEIGPERKARPLIVNESKLCLNRTKGGK